MKAVRLGINYLETANNYQLSQLNYGLDTGTVWKSIPAHEPVRWRHVCWQAESPDREVKERSRWGWLFYRRVKMDGRTVLDNIVEEVDVRTGRVLLRWSAAHHVDLRESYVPPFKDRSRPWDFFHINSIDVTGGRMLASMRNTWTAYMVHAGTGRIEWRLGGKRSDFDLPQAARFEWQHDVQAEPGSVVSLFDNHCCEFSGVGEYLEATGSSRALILKLDPERVVTLGGTGLPFNEIWTPNPDLSRVDEVGFADLMPGSGHGTGGYIHLGTIEVFGRPVPRGAATK